MAMTREKAKELVDRFGAAAWGTGYFCHKDRVDLAAATVARNNLRPQLIDVLCADPNAEAIDKLRQAALGVLGLIMLFPIDELAPLERREFWGRQIAAAASDLKEGLNATREG